MKTLTRRNITFAGHVASLHGLDALASSGVDEDTHADVGGLDTVLRTEGGVHVLQRITLTIGTGVKMTGAGTVVVHQEGGEAWCTVLTSLPMAFLS